MSIRHQIHHIDGTSTAVTISGNPATLTIDIAVDPATGGFIPAHSGKTIQWIDVFYAAGDKADFLLKCLHTSTGTPTIDKVRVGTDAAQGNTASWVMTPTGTFDIQFTQPGLVPGFVNWEFNPGADAPPLKLNVIVRRDP
jgi:hypothetical protein